MLEERPYFSIEALKLLGICLSFCFRIHDSAFAQSADDPIRLETFKTHSRLSIQIDETVAPQWKNKPGSFEVFLPGVGYADLGAPLGEEEKWKRRFEGLGDLRVADLKLVEVLGGLKITGSWKFPKGMAALANPRMEFFDYRQKVPPEYLIDFWVKKGPTLIEARAAQIQAERIAALKKAEEDAKKRTARRLASEKAKLEADDTEKFCRQPLSEETDVFLPLLPFHETVSFARWFPSTTPDAAFPYFQPETKTKDAEYVRLALELNRQGKPGLIIRTLDFMDAEYPNSEFRLEMRFLRANALIRLGLNEEASLILNGLKLEAKQTPAALYSGMFLAGQLMTRGSYLAALESFSCLISLYPKHRLNWVFHLGVAEALYQLKQTERAGKEYEWIVENASDPKAKAEAGLRIGDIYLQRAHYDQALAAYFRGLTHFGSQAKDFPAVHINRAESLYGLGQFERARESFEKFVENYPNHPSGWRASFRLGEIYGRRQKQGDWAASRKWYYETINRFPYSPGATLARTRLIPCGDHGGFNSEAIERFFSGEAMKFDGNGEVSMARYPALRGLSHARVLIALGFYEQAVNVLYGELRGNPVADVRVLLNHSLASAFRKSVMTLLAQGKAYEALKYYRENEGKISKDSVGRNSDYLLKLSEAAIELGLGGLAQELAQAYQSVQPNAGLQDGRSIASTSAQPGKGADLDEKLKHSETVLAEAKALGLAFGFSSAEKIRSLLSQVSDEASGSWEKEVILALLAEKEGKLKSALEHGLAAQMLIPNSRVSLRIESWTAGMEAQVGDPQVALEMYRNLENHLLKLKPDERDIAETTGLPLPTSLEDAITAQAKILEKQGRWGDAASVYSRALDSGVGGTQTLYSYAIALLRTGEVQAKNRAYATLERLVGGKQDDFWKKLAKETLENEKSRREILGEAKEGQR